MMMRLRSRSRGCPIIALGCGLVLLLAAQTPLTARAQAVSDDQILDAIHHQVNYLLSQKQQNNWEAREKYGGMFFAPGSQTSMVLYSLLYAGRCIDDERLKSNSPELKPAIVWVCKVDPTFTYTAAMQANALALVQDVMHVPLYRNALSHAAQCLVDNVGLNGAYSYTWNPPVQHQLVHWNGHPDHGDNSNSQYGLLGVWAAQDVGVEIPVNYWTVVNQYWRGCQDTDGGWDYFPNPGRSYLNMATAGLASLYITTECVDQSPPRLEAVPDPGIERGLAWMKANFSANDDAYGLYGCERVGLASGLKYFGTTNWYQAGAAAILAAQQDDGSSRLHVKFMDRDDPIPSTAYALLFLCRGRNPVLFNKLEYHNPKDPKRLIWDARPRDLANLTHQYSKIFEQDFNWHVVNLQVSAEDWLDSPVLLITGSEDPHFTPDDIAKLKTFVDDGGIIFSTADGAKLAFTAAMKKYASQIVGGQYEMRELPKDHAIFNIQYPVVNPPRMLGMTNGIRELWIHSPSDMGAIWQMRALSHRADWDIPANIYLYATGKVNSREKFQNLIVSPGNDPTVRNIALARVSYAGNWDPEPGAWPRMAKLAQARFHTNLQISDVPVANLDPMKTPVAHLTGTAGFTLAPDGVAALKKYLDDGGTLLVDAGGGSDTFNSSFSKLVAQLYPKDSLDDLSPDSPVITGKITDGVDASSVDFRRNTLKKRATPPVLALVRNGRDVIYYSTLDLTSGLLGTNTWGIMGYAPDSAQAVLRNMLLVAAQPNAQLKQLQAVAQAHAGTQPATGPQPTTSTQPAAK